MSAKKAVLIANANGGGALKCNFTNLWRSLKGRCHIMSQPVYVIPYCPVGEIKEFDRPMDMNSIYGGTWELYGKGRVTVGVDTNDSDFDTGGKTGGSKSLQKHSHTGKTKEGRVFSSVYRICTGTYSSAEFNLESNHASATPNVGSTYTDLITDQEIPGGNHCHSFTTAEAGSGNAGNLQPYITVYRYRKVAD